MNLNQVTVPSTDVARSAAFYRRLGLRQIVEDLPGYVRFECPSGGATFSVHRVEQRAPSAHLVVYFECDDLDAKVASLRERGVVFDVPPQDQPWLWREAYLRDPDDNVICLYQAGSNRKYPPWRLRERHPDGVITITVESDPSSEDVRVLSEGLTEHALPTTVVAGFQPLAAFARADDGTIVGGAYALVNWNWLAITILWVAGERRGTGLGHRLLTSVEEAGAARGCTHAHLDTFSYQARPFYERHGYEVFATLDDYPPGHRRFFLRKTLGSVPAAQARP